jgi:hypothetical protein
MSRLTPGWLARHTPQGPGGRQAALIDIAQDLLLARLHQRGVFDHLVFKGGTALRKLYAGNAGRFSTDLDFSIRDPADHPETDGRPSLVTTRLGAEPVSELPGSTGSPTDEAGPDSAHASLDAPCWRTSR